MICDNCEAPIFQESPDLQLKLKDCYIVCRICFARIDNFTVPEFYTNNFEGSKL
jgi:hypothetical protein